MLEQFREGIGRGVEKVLTIMLVATFYRRYRDEQHGKKKQDPEGGQRKK